MPIFFTNWFRPQSVVERSRPLFLHCGLVVAVILYTLFGGLSFHLLESDNDDQLGRQHERLVANRSACYTAAVNNATRVGVAASVRELDSCNERFDASTVLRQNWAFLASIMFAFTVITTIGYGNAAPVTVWGRCFCIVYGLVGIPLCMMAIANLGKFLLEHGRTLSTKYLRSRASSARADLEDGEPDELAEDELDDLSAGKTGILLLFAFVIYIIIGALTLPLYETEMTFFSAIYFNFVTLTTIGLGDLVPTSNEFLLFTLLYITVGLALTTIAIDVASDYLKKLHYFGRKLTNVGNVTIWFGGQKLSVKGLVESMGANFGVSPEQLQQTINRLDDFVVRAIVAEETNQPIVLFDEPTATATVEKQDEKANSAADSPTSKREDGDDDDDGGGFNVGSIEFADSLHDDGSDDSYDVDALSDVSVPLLSALLNGPAPQHSPSQESVNELELPVGRADSGTWSEDESVSGKLQVSQSHDVAEIVCQEVVPLVVFVPADDNCTPDPSYPGVQPARLPDSEDPSTTDDADEQVLEAAEEEGARGKLSSSASFGGGERRASSGSPIEAASVIVKVPQHDVGRRDFKHDPKKAFELYQRQWAKFDRRTSPSVKNRSAAPPVTASSSADASPKRPATAKPPPTPKTRRKAEAALK